jgi:diguanylate cyclase (GGDEF)-like protein
MDEEDIKSSSPVGQRRRLAHLTEPHILFPAIAVLGLAAVWVPTLSLVRDERAGAEHAAALSSRELVGTYEAQVVRALSEIDETLKVLKYAYEVGTRPVAMHDLEERGLLPPDLLFVVAIADDKGLIVASTRQLETNNVADEDYFLSQRQTNSLSIGRPQKDPVSGEWKLRFSRRLDASDGSFAGIALVSVDAAFFVSSYESAELGERGVLGVLGTDGVFRARRSGEIVSAGDKVDYAAMTVGTDENVREAPLTLNEWDGVRRYTSVRQLYDFPLAVIVGLSAEEQSSGTRKSTNAYLRWASAGSLLILTIVALLGTLSRRLAQSRARSLSEHIAHAARVEYLAYHDGLTQLPNRSLFHKILGQRVNEASRYKRQLAVLFLDLDRFKDINDTLGHEAGDQLLQEVSRRLKACLRDGDMVARLGGDEFVALLQLTDPVHAAVVARKILSAVAQPFSLLGREFRVTASIGISIFPKDGLDEQTLTKNADIAMYKAKEEGKNNLQFYSENLNAHSLERLTLESGLRHALEQGEFQLHYQTKREIRSGRITGVEALLRWQHPDLGLLAPMRFIPVAEETGLIVPIGNWVLRTACLQIVAWRSQGLPPVSMAVNLTARQFFEEHLLSDLLAITTDTGMDPRLLELEIHESLLMRNVEKAMEILTRLKDMGIRIAIDDFGAGYVSLSALKQFPLNTIKIDRSFIRDVASVAEDKDLTEAIIAMGRTLSLTVVAVGVETKAQVDFLQLNACDEFQGFYVNKPLPGNQIAELLREQSGFASDSGLNI